MAFEDDSDDPLLWATALRDMPAPAARKFFSYVSALTRENAQLAAELERLRPQPTPEEIRTRRDVAIVAALEQYQGRPTVRAEALAKDLRTATGLKQPPSSERLRAAAEILRLNGGASLRWRQLYEIWRMS